MRNSGFQGVPIWIVLAGQGSTWRRQVETYNEIRRRVVEAAKKMADRGMVVGTAGNVSARIEGTSRFVITPSSLPYADMEAEDTVVAELDGTVVEGRRAPSSEFLLHSRIYTARPDVKAVIHTHSPHATALAALRMPIPPFLDELVTYIGGPVAVAQYALSASRELAENACAALEDRAAVLLANHGTVSVGADLEKAFHTAELVEEAARIYLLARSVGLPVEIPPESFELYRTLYTLSKSGS